MTDLLVVLNEGKRHFVMGKKENQEEDDGWVWKGGPLKGSSFSFLVGSCRGIQSPEYVFPVSWTNQVTRKTGFLSSSCPQGMGIPTVHQKGR